MPGRADPNIDPAALLERRRAQNRLAQHRFRQKKLAQAKANGGSSTAAQNSVSSAEAAHRPELASTSSVPSKDSHNVPIEIPAGLGNTIPRFIDAAPFVDLFAQFDDPSTSSPANPVYYNGLNSASSSSSSAVPHRDSSYGSSSASNHSEGSEGSSMSSSSSGGSPSDTFDETFTLPLASDGSDALELISSPPNQVNPRDPSQCTYSQPANAATVSASTRSSHKWSDTFLTFELAQTLTQEKGMLAVILFQTGSPSLAALRATLGSPTAGQVFQVKNPFAKAFYHNAVTIGFLDNDLRTCAGVSSIEQVWPRRSAPVLQGLAVPGDSAVDATGSPPSPKPYSMPANLSSFSEARRAYQLRENPNMHPTKLQLEHRHSILIDTLPWPNVRDALIRLCAAGVTNGVDIKADMLGRTFDCIGEGHTFTIHGDDPCDPETWEVSEYFAKRYSFILDKNIIRRTNFWRRLRGLPNLDLDQQPSQSAWIVDALMNASATLL